MGISINYKSNISDFGLSFELKSLVLFLVFLTISEVRLRMKIRLK